MTPWTIYPHGGTVNLSAGTPTVTPVRNWYLKVTPIGPTAMPAVTSRVISSVGECKSVKVVCARTLHKGLWGTRAQTTGRDTGGGLRWPLPEHIVGPPTTDHFDGIRDVAMTQPPLRRPGAPNKKRSCSKQKEEADPFWSASCLVLGRRIELLLQD